MERFAPVRRKTWGILLGLLLAVPLLGQPAARSYSDGHGGTVAFPLGDLSFADEIVGFQSGNPAATHEGDRIPDEALGPPDYDAGADDNYLTLGCGGVLTLRFTNNVLTDRPGPDLYVFEIGPAVEPTRLWISRDGEHWLDVGEIAGGRADVDISGVARKGDFFYVSPRRTPGCAGWVFVAGLGDGS